MRENPKHLGSRIKDPHAIRTQKKAPVSECLFAIQPLVHYFPGIPGVRPFEPGALEESPAPFPPPAGLSPVAARPGGMGGASGGSGGGGGVHPTRKLVKTIVQNQLLRDIRYLKSN
jgi:hypothetical protein